MHTLGSRHICYSCKQQLEIEQIEYVKQKSCMYCDGQSMCDSCQQRLQTWFERECNLGPCILFKKYGMEQITPTFINCHPINKGKRQVVCKHLSGKKCSCFKEAREVIEAKSMSLDFEFMTHFTKMMTQIMIYWKAYVVYALKSIKITLCYTHIRYKILKI